MTMMSENADNFDWESIGSMTIGDAGTRPPRKPEGFYVGKVEGMFDRRTVNTKDGEKLIIQFPLRIVRGHTVDENQLEAAGGVPNATIRAEFWMTKLAMWRFADFTRLHGVDESTPIPVACEEVCSNPQEFIVELKYGRPNQRGDTYLEPVSFAALDTDVPF